MLDVIGYRRVFQFTVPNLDEFGIIMPVESVNSFVRSLDLIPVPFSPKYILGLAEWSDMAVPVIDIAGLLSPAGQKDELSEKDFAGYMILNITAQGHSAVIACPVLAGSGIVYIPSQLDHIDLPDELNAGNVYAAGMMDGMKALMLSFDEIFASAFSGK